MPGSARQTVKACLGVDRDTSIGIDVKLEISKR